MNSVEELKDKAAATEAMKQAEETAKEVSKELSDEEMNAVSGGIVASLNSLNSLSHLKSKTVR